MENLPENVAVTHRHWQSITVTGWARFRIDDEPVLVAGGGGGGGGESGAWFGVQMGGPGGVGCAGEGRDGSTSTYGGGGGGGLCDGTTNIQGVEEAPHGTALLPGGRATGGTGDCADGGAGFGVVTFAP